MSRCERDLSDLKLFIYRLSKQIDVASLDSIDAEIIRTIVSEIKAKERDGGITSTREK